MISLPNLIVLFPEIDLGKHDFHQQASQLWFKHLLLPGLNRMFFQNIDFIETSPHKSKLSMVLVFKFWTFNIYKISEAI